MRHELHHTAAVALVILTVLQPGCTTSSELSTCETGMEETPALMLAVWSDVHVDGPGAGLHLHLAAWSDGVIIKSFDKRCLQAVRVEPGYIIGAVEGLENIGFFDAEPFTVVDLGGYSAIAAYDLSHANAFVLNAPPAAVETPRSERHQLWDDSFQVIDAIANLEGDEVDLSTMADDDGVFCGVVLSDGFAPWMMADPISDWWEDPTPVGLP